MSFLGLDAIIVYAFLAITLVVGLFYSGGVKSLRDYAVGHGEFSSVVLFATLSATIVGGYWLVGMSGELYDVGIIYFCVACGAIVGFALIFFVMIPNIDSRFEGSLSVHDIAHTLYGKIPSKFTAAFGIVNCGAILCVQLIALGNVLAQFLDIPFTYGVSIPAGILILYSTLGGVKSVAMTDLIQFCVMVVMVPLLAKFALDSNGGIVSVFSQIPHEKFSMDAIFKAPHFWEYFCLFLCYCLPFVSLEPTIIQRMLMCRDPKVRKKISVSFVIVLGLIICMSLFIAFSVLVAVPDLGGGSKVFAEAMGRFFPVGLRGLMVAGLLAAIMSTADSCLNSASVLTAQLFGLDKERKRSMVFVKIITLSISCIALYVSLKNLSIIRVSVFADLCIAVFVNVPLFLGVCRFKISRALYYTSLITCGIAMITFMILGVPIMYIPLIGAFLSTVILLSKQILSFEYRKFFAALPVKVLRMVTKMLAPLKHPIRLFTVIGRYFNNTLSRYKASYFAFALFCILNYVFPLLNQNYLFANALNFNTYLYALGIVLCIILLMRKHLPIIPDRIFAIYWVFTLLYCLPFMSIYLFLQNNTSLSWSVNMAIGIMLLASLVPWFMFIILTVLGSTFAITLSILIAPAGTFHFTNSNLDIVGYAVLLSLVIGSIFIRHRQVQQEERTAMMNLFSGAVAHELREPLVALQMQAGMLIDVVETKGEEAYNSVEKQILRDSALELKRLTARGLQTMRTLLFAIQEDLEIIDKELYNIRDCTFQAIDEYCDAYPMHKQLIHCSIDEKNDFQFTGSKTLTKQVIINLLSNAFKHGGANVEVYITVDKNNTIYFKDIGNGMDSDTLKKIFHRFYTTRATGTGIGLTFCELAIRKMGGFIKCESELGEYTKFSIYLPCLNGSRKKLSGA